MTDSPLAAPGGRLARLERWLFGRRRAVLAALTAFTLLMGWFATRLHMDAGFEKQMPIGHEYIQTFDKYREDVLGANRLLQRYWDFGHYH